jgi:hypothetical protein
MFDTMPRGPGNPQRLSGREQAAGVGSRRRRRNGSARVIHIVIRQQWGIDEALMTVLGLR